MKKILILLNSLDLGGSQTYVLTIVKEFQKRGYKITIAAKYGALTPEARRYAEKVIDCRVDAAFRWPVDNQLKGFFRIIILYIPALVKVFNLCRKEKYDFIITQQPSPTFLAIIMAVFFKVPVLYIVHHVLPNEFPPLWHNIIKYRLPPIVAISEEIRAFLINNCRIEKERISVIINCIDIGFFQNKTKKNNLKRKIVYASSLNGAKINAVENFINSASIVARYYKDVEFYLLGNGDLYEKSLRLALGINKKIGSDVVRLVGGQVNVLQYIQDADIFVGIARSAREAMALGIPTILMGHLKGDKGGNYGGIINENNIEELEYYNLSGRNSNIVATPEILAKDIVKLLHDKDLALKISDFGKQYIIKRCSSETICEQIEQRLLLNL